jgi:hypothetical protein
MENSSQEVSSLLMSNLVNELPSLSPDRAEVKTNFEDTVG